VNQRLAVSILEKQGHAVTVVRNGREALAALEKEKPFDVVLMDVQMPELDGLEATAAIRAQEKGTGRHVPILAMTAYAMNGDREKCLAAGMDGYVAKPARRRELLDALDAVLPNATPSTSESDGPPAAGENTEWSEALAGVGGDSQLLAKLAGIFLDEYPKELAVIRSTINEGDSDGLLLAAHSLKGELSTFVARAAYEAALRLETTARQGDLSAAPEGLSTLIQELERLRPAVTALAREAADPSPAAARLARKG